MPSKEATYEVLVGSGDRWVIDSIHEAKTVAMARAKSLLTSNEHDAVRVTREAGGRSEEIVFQQECVPKAEKPITISSIDDAALCGELVDLTSFEARKTAGRVLRKYLNEYGITALEALHDHHHLRDLRRTERLFDQAIHKVASVQARAQGEDAQTRIDLLYRLATQLIDQTRDTRGTEGFLTIAKDDGLTAALRAIGTSFSEDARPFYICSVLASYVGQARDWPVKLGLIIDLLEKQPDNEALRHLDEICAEILDGSTAVMEILGPQRDLVTALHTMARLSAGSYQGKKRGDALLTRLNKLVSRYPMPRTCGILLERVAREVSGTNPLTRENEDADKAAFPKLVRDLISFGGLRGGSAISEAVTRRARIVMKSEDRDLSAQEGIVCILAILPNQAVKIGYLLDLSRSEFGIKHRPLVLATLLDIVKPIDSLSGLLPPGSSHKKLAQAVDDMRLRLGDDALGQEIGALIAKKLESLIEESPSTGKDNGSGLETKTPEPPKTQNANNQNNRTYQAGDIIFREADPGDEAYMILSGEVQISVGIGTHKVIIATLGRGEIIGEMALVDDQPRMATATAVTDVTLYVIPQEAFKKRLLWLSEEDRLISHVIETLVSRLRDQMAGT